MNNTTNKTIADYAITYSMSIAAYNPTKKVVDVQLSSASAYGCKAKTFTGTVYLIDDEFTRDLCGKVREIRRFYDDNTLKLGLTDVIPSANYWRVADFASKAIPEFDRLAKQFVDNWYHIRDTSRNRLVNLYYVPSVTKAKTWVLSQAQVSELIYFQFKKSPMANPRDLDTIQGFTDDMRDAFRQEMMADMSILEQKANEQISQRLRKVLTDFITKFKTCRITVEFRRLSRATFEPSPI